jgi:hypothetical protein
VTWGLRCQHEEQPTGRGQTRKRFTCGGETLPTATRLASDFAAKIQTGRTTDRESIWATAINATACAMDPGHDALLHPRLKVRLAQRNQSHVRNRRTIQRMNLPPAWTPAYTR